MKILVDTNIWSTVLRKPQTNQSVVLYHFKSIITSGHCAIIGPIRQEILSGIRDKKTFIKLREYLSVFEDEVLTQSDYENAATVFNDCRASGITISAIDALIISICKNHDLKLYTHDKDFVMYAKIGKISLYQETSI